MLLEPFSCGIRKRWESSLHDAERFSSIDSFNMATSLEYTNLLRVVYISSSLLILYVFVSKARVALFGPLSKIPGPPIARWTNIRLKVAVLSGRRMYYIDSLHQKYGCIVRVAPFEVSISDPTAFKEMHKIQGGCRKSDWYTKLTGESEPGMFSATDPKVHSERRKLFANTFTSGFLRKVEPSIQSKVKLTVARIKEEVQIQGTADVLKWWTFFATDVIGELSFGDSFRMLEQGKVSIPSVHALLFSPAEPKLIPPQEKRLYPRTRIQHHLLWPPRRAPPSQTLHPLPPHPQIESILLLPHPPQ